MPGSFPFHGRQAQASFHDSLHCTGRFAFEKKEGKGRRRPLCGWTPEAPETPRSPPSSAWIACRWVFLLPLLSCSLPDVLTLREDLAPCPKLCPPGTHTSPNASSCPLYIPGIKQDLIFGLWKFHIQSEHRIGVFSPHFKSTLVGESKWGTEEWLKKWTLN